MDDVMRWLWVQARQARRRDPGTVDRPYGSDDVVEALAAVSGDRAWAERLIADYVIGRSVMDYPRLLALAGFVVTKRASGEASLGPDPDRALGRPAAARRTGSAGLSGRRGRPRRGR